MDSRQLLESMSLIDDKYILSAGRGRVTNKLGGRYVRMIGGIAACVCIAVGMVFCVTHLKNPSDPYENPPEQTTGTDTPTVPESDFVIENGVLIAYTGCETEVVVPDEVRIITDKSFSGEALAKTVTAIHLGAAVEQIDEKSFGSLTALESITVDENNPVYFSDKGILVKRDGTLYCQPNKCEGEAWTINEIIEEMEDKNEFFNDISKISVGQAIIDLQFIDNGIKNCKRYCYMTSISAYGHKKVFEKPVGLKIMDMLQFDDIFIMSENYGSGGDKWVFTKYGITAIPDDNRIGTLNPLTNLIESGYGITFMYRDDGKIGYVRRPYKYIGIQDASYLLRCVARDELYKEEGYAVFENNEFVYYPEKTLTLSEVRDIDSEFQMFKSYDLSGWPSEIQNAQTLDDLIEYNKTVYARAK